MSDYNWSIYDRDWGEWLPNKQGEHLINELKLYGDPIALAWFPPNSLPPRLEKYIYRGGLKMVHCQFMQRARFRGEIYILDGVKSRPDPPVCNGDAYVGLTKVREQLMMGLTHTRTNPKTGEPARLGIFGSPAASRRSLKNHYWIVPPHIEYFAIAPLSNCPFDPDVVTIIGNARQATMACRALQYFTGEATIGETGPGTCSSSWVAAYLSGEPHYTLGCHGVFGTTGIDPNEICLSIPGEQMPTICEVLKLWRDRGKEMFKEAPPNEERLFVRVPYDASYQALARIDHEKGVKASGPQILETTYISWSERRKRMAQES